VAVASRKLFLRSTSFRGLRGAAQLSDALAERQVPAWASAEQTLLLLWSVGAQHQQLAHALPSQGTTVQPQRMQATSAICTRNSMLRLTSGKPRCVTGGASQNTLVMCPRRKWQPMSAVKRFRGR